MSHLADGRDSVPLEARAKSPRVQSEAEILDLVVTDAAMDQEPKITRKPDGSFAQSKTAKQFSRLLPTHDVPSASGTVEQPPGRLVSNAIATLVNAMPEEMKTLIVNYAKQILRENSDDQT